MTTRPADTIRTVDAAITAGMRAAAADPPLTQTQVNQIALILAPYRAQLAAMRQENGQ